MQNSEIHIRYKTASHHHDEYDNYYLIQWDLFMEESVLKLEFYLQTNIEHLAPLL